MTTEIEKQFFDTFGIEPKCETRAEHRKHECYGMVDCNECAGAVYPQITDRILLKLISIISQKPFGYLQCEDTYATNLCKTRGMIVVEADDLKEGLLTLAIQKKVALRIKHIVQALFEEG